MKVMQILPLMNIGGVERGVLDLVRFFKRESLSSIQKKVKNIVVSGGGGLVKGLEKEGVTHYKLPVYKKSPLILFLVPKLRKIINEERIDIVHARSRMPGWVSFFASRKSRAVFITTAHGVYKNRFFSEVMGWGKYIICPSRVVARHMKNNFGVPEEKIIIVNRWVDLNKFQFTGYQQRRESNVIVSIGRISPTKGYEYLITGFKKIVRLNPYLKLKIVGSADKSKVKYLNYLKTLVSRFSLNYNVEFVGFKEDIENVLAEARILIVPSVIEESFGRVVIEAFACGVPVVATKVGGFKEIIEDGADGLLIEPGNSEEITGSILKILGDSDYAERLAKQARKKVEQRYTMEKCLQETEKVYEKTLGISKILVIKISSLGDLILSFPSLKELRHKFPKDKICLLTLKRYHSFLRGCPYVDKIITMDDKYKKFKNILRVAEGLRRESFDYIVDLQNNRPSHVISFLSLGRYSFGYALRWGFLLTKKIKYNREDNPLDSQERILQFLGIRFKEKKLVFWQREGELPVSLPDAGLIGINVSASRKWQSKNWPSKNILKLIEMIHKNLPAFRVVLFGNEEAKEQAEEIEKSSICKLSNLCGKITLGDLPRVVEKLKVFITPDTATLHLSCALDIPTIALFGPTDPRRHTVKSKNLYIYCEKLPCSFCYRPKCNLKKGNLCLEKITSRQIFAKIKEILNPR